MIRTPALFAVVLLAALTIPSATAAPGDLDPSLAGKGWVHTREFFPNYDQRYQPKGAEDIALQADGKIVLTGDFEDSGSNWYFGAYRLTASGGLDRSFGEGGWVDTQVGGFDFPHAVALQRDGKILLAGESRCNGLFPCAVVIRYLPSGALDRSFGGTGIVTVGGKRIDAANDVAVQPDGRIVVFGSHFAHDRWHDYLLFSVVRLLPDGGLDRSFSKDGAVHVGLRAGTGQYPKAMVLQRDGKIVLVGAGAGRFINEDDFEIVRLRRDGRVDRTFSRDGIAKVDFRHRSDTAMGVALQRDGRIVVSGASAAAVKPATNRIALVRLKRNGTLDRRFGKRLTNPGPHGGAADGVLVQPDGRIVVAGRAYDDDWDSTSAWAIVRYLSNGRLDRSFGRSGIAIGDFGTGHDWASSLELQPDGKLLVGGSIYEDEAVARLRLR